MAKRKGIEKKAALLHQHFKGELQKVDENELGEWSKENLQRNRDHDIKQTSPWVSEGLSPFEWFDKQVKDREEKLQKAA